MPQLDINMFFHTFFFTSLFFIFLYFCWICIVEILPFIKNSLIFFTNLFKRSYQNFTNFFSFNTGSIYRLCSLEFLIVWVSYYFCLSVVGFENVPISTDMPEGVPTGFIYGDQGYTVWAYLLFLFFFSLGLR